MNGDIIRLTFLIKFGNIVFDTRGNYGNYALYCSHTVAMLSHAAESNYEKRELEMFRHSCMERHIPNSIFPERELCTLAEVEMNLPSLFLVKAVI